MKHIKLHILTNSFFSMYVNLSFHTCIQILVFSSCKFYLFPFTSDGQRSILQYMLK